MMRKIFIGVLLLTLVFGISNVAVADVKNVVGKTPDGKTYGYYDKGKDKIRYRVTKLARLAPGSMVIEVREVKKNGQLGDVFNNVSWQSLEDPHGVGFLVYDIPPDTFLDLAELQGKGLSIIAVDTDPYFARPRERKSPRNLADFGGIGYDWHIIRNEGIFFEEHELPSFTVWFVGP
ncbi:MAG: hypothetical protein LBQ90_06330 [Synergistaceae bacterium]|jgi:hypothetical protein|nr:hypothetical protein [Synergistaceae bacterium]